MGAAAGRALAAPLWQMAGWHDGSLWSVMIPLVALYSPLPACLPACLPALRAQPAESYVDDNKRAKWCPSVPHCGNAIRSKDPNCEVGDLPLSGRFQSNAGCST